MTTDVTTHPTRDHPPPHDLDAERALLGAALLRPEAAAVAATVDPAAFYGWGHQHIAAAVAAIHRRGEPVDAITVCDELRSAGLLGKNAGQVDPADVVTLQSAAPSTTAAKSYADIVVAHYVRRRVGHIADELLRASYDPTIDPTALVERARTDLAEQVATTTTSTLQWADVEALLAQGLEPTIDPDVLRRADGRSLLYSGRVHMLQGEPGSAKTWLALHAVAEVIGGGRNVVYLDCEDTDSGIVGRLLALGADPRRVASHLFLARPSGPVDVAEIDDIDDIVATSGARLVIIDGVAEALTASGFDEDNAREFVEWFNKIPRRLAAHGPAVVLLDHVVKSREERGRWARGTGAKLGAIDGAAYELRVVDPFSRDVAGKVQIVVAKDRPGSVGANGAPAAYVHIIPRDHGATVELRVEAPTDDELAGLPTAAMEAVSRHLADHGPTSRGQLPKAVARFRPDVVARAVAELIRRGHVRERQVDVGPGGRASTVLTHVTPYPPPAPPEEEF